MNKRPITEQEIDMITQNCPLPLEKAFFTIMRQSGLTPTTITQLKISDVERILDLNPPIPCKITIGKSKGSPYFIAGESVKYLKRYLANRKNLTPESLLFTAHGDQDKKINPKNVSRRFRIIAKQLAKNKQITYKSEGGKPSQLRLYSLIDFYKSKTKTYQEKLKNNPHNDHESLKTLYQQHAMANLEIENQRQIVIFDRHKKRYQTEMQYLNNEIKEKSQTITLTNEYISSILALLYNNKGDYETGENIELGNHFIQLWKRTAEEQTQHMKESFTNQTELLPYKDILEELTKTLKRIIKPYEELKKPKLASQEPHKPNDHADHHD